MENEKKQGNILQGSKKNGTTIHESSIKPGTGSGNLYNHVPKNAVQNQNLPKLPAYGL